MKTKYIFKLAISLLFLTGCEEFLSEKPDQALIVPRSINDLWAILDNSTQVMNQEGAHIEGSSDDVIILPFLYNALSLEQKNTYTWNSEIFETPSALDWNQPFRQIFFVNTVLSELDNLPESEKSSSEFNTLKGAALFFRAYAYFSLSKQFCPGYLDSSAANELGLPLRTTPNITDPVQRSNLKDTFMMILNDLEESEKLLPDTSPHITRPTRAASRAMLSRVHLYMGNFEKSLEYADLTLEIKNDILDYNNVNPAPARPFVNEFEEVIFYSELLFYTYYYFSDGAAVVPELVETYHENDLRRQLFFYPRGDHFAFRGQYSFLVRLFSGLATDEIYLNKAECHARLGQRDDALASLNMMLEKRFVSGTFEPYGTDYTEDVLNLVLLERRKQLLFRGIRWGDLKRLNLLPGEEIFLTRTTPDGVFNLPPNDPRYAFPIPEEELQLSGILQNPR